MMHIRFSIIVAGLLMVFLWAGCQGGTQETAQADVSTGRQVYATYCAVCHQANGEGLAGVYPPVSQTEWIQGDEGRLIRLLLNGMTGQVEVKGSTYNNAMTPHAFLSDEQIAAVLTFVRSNFGNQAPPVTPEAVAAVRAANNKEGLWQAHELEDQTGIPGQGEEPVPAAE